MTQSKFLFEHKSKPVIPIRQFFMRQLRFLGYASILLVGSLGIGMAGYRYHTGMDWMDAFLNASMILTGMGPVNQMPTPAAKFFAGVYALFSGVIFLTTVAVMFTPIVHRLLHLMHIDDTDEN